MTTPPRVLIVDDDPMNRDILETLLAAHRFVILTAVDGEAGLAVAREQHPDLILLDVMMPKMDGIEVCRRLKSDPALPFMPVIMVTARGAGSAERDRAGDELHAGPPSAARRS